MSKNFFLFLVLLFSISSCNVYYSEINPKQEVEEVIGSDPEQEALLVGVIDYLKKEKSFGSDEMIIDSLDLIDTIFIKTKDTTLCKKKYFYFNNILTPTIKVGSFDYPKHGGRCLDVSFSLLSNNEIDFSYNKLHGSNYHGSLRFYYDVDKRIFCCVNYGISH